MALQPCEPQISDQVLTHELDLQHGAGKARKELPMLHLDQASQAQELLSLSARLVSHNHSKHPCSLTEAALELQWVIWCSLMSTDYSSDK